MAYPQFSEITKANMLSDFNTLVITARNSVIVWAAGEGAWDTSFATSLSGGGLTGDPFFPNNTMGTAAFPNLFSASTINPLSSRTSSAATAASLTDPIGANNIYNTFRDAAYVASAIRLVRLIKYLYTTDTRINKDEYVDVWNYTRYSSLNNSYRVAVNAPSGAPSGIITAAGLDTFVTELRNSLAAIANLTVGAVEYYCHSSCHSSCHNSRGRR
jgi:hypothetical protein